MDPIEYKLGDEVRTRKKHPCGSERWKIIRVGMDIKIKCLGCGHIVMIERAQFNRWVRAVYPQQEHPSSES